MFNLTNEAKRIHQRWVSRDLSDAEMRAMLAYIEEQIRKHPVVRR